MEREEKGACGTSAVVSLTKHKKFVVKHVGFNFYIEDSIDFWSSSPAWIKAYHTGSLNKKQKLEFRNDKRRSSRLTINEIR